VSKWPWSAGDFPGERLFKTRENAERYATSYVQAHLSENFVPRVSIYFLGLEIAQVIASADNRVWIDMKDSNMPADMFAE